MDSNIQLFVCPSCGSLGTLLSNKEEGSRGAVGGGSTYPSGRTFDTCLNIYACSGATAERTPIRSPQDASSAAVPFCPSQTARVHKLGYIYMRARLVLPGPLPPGSKLPPTIAEPFPSQRLAGLVGPIRPPHRVARARSEAGGVGLVRFIREGGANSFRSVEAQLRRRPGVGRRLSCMFRPVFPATRGLVV